MTDAHDDRLSRPYPAELLATLAPWERWHVRVAHRMNREPVKAAWTQAQRLVGAFFVRALTRNLVREHGWEHVETAYRQGTILFVANHRTYFDMFVVSSLIHRRLPGRKRLYFPVTGKYYYQSAAGMVFNQFLAWWSMFPPLFALPTHTAVDQYALEILTDLCRRGPGTILGIHPEGGRNLDPDPWSYLRFQPGAGRIIHVARPIVIPVFIAGLHPDPAEQVRRGLRGGEPVRLWFDAPVDLSAHYALPAKGSTYKKIVDDVMARVQHLGEQDRARYGPGVSGSR